MPIVYADYAATTPLDPRVLEAMMPYLKDVFYNASSTHAGGLQAQQAVMKARMDIAKHIGARMSEIVFTSGATEAINLALLGLARGNAQRKRMVTVATEHHAVLDSCEHCEHLNIDVEFIGVDKSGRIDLDAVRRAVDANTLVLSVMAVNNETGVIQDLGSLSEVAHAHGALFMTDATQAYGKMPLNVDALGIDLMAFSGHKIYGPKGVGALYCRSLKDSSFAIEPLLFGGGQEGGIRSGTLNVPGIVGLATAGNIAHVELATESAHIRTLRDKFEYAMVQLGNVRVNGAEAERNYNICNLTFADAEPDRIMSDLPHIACSKGSACTSTDPKPSHVLTAMGHTPDEANRSLRFSFGRFTTEQEIDQLIHDMSAALVSA